MPHAQMIEGSTEEVTRLLQQDYAGQQLRVFVEPKDGEDGADGLPVPPFAVRDEAHLEALLLEGLASPAAPFTDETLEQMRQAVRTRRMHKQP